MTTIWLIEKEKIAFETFSWLSENASNANIDTLKQISAYIAKTANDKFDINCNCECKKLCFDNDNYYLLSLDDGRKIIFSEDSSRFNFWVFKRSEETRMSMSLSVYERIPGDLSTTSVYGEVSVEDAGKYVVTFRPKDLNDDILKYGTINYYSGDEIDWVHTVVGSYELDGEFDLVARKNDIYPFAEKSYFDLSYEDDIALDELGGYVSNSMARVDLLLSNAEILRKNALASAELVRIKDLSQAENSKRKELIKKKIAEKKIVDNKK